MVRYVSCGTRNSLEVATMLWPQKLRATNLERVECGGEGVLRFSVFPAFRFRRFFGFSFSGFPVFGA